MIRPNKLFIYFVLFGMCTLGVAYAWNIGSKGRVNGPAIHTTYFLTPNNQSFLVHAQAYVGTFMNGYCRYNTVYDLGNEMIKTGDMIDIDAFRLRFVIAGGNSCMSIYYYYHQLVIENFKLIWDGFNYTSSIPFQNEITIL